MAQVSRICNGRSHNTQVFLNNSKSHKPKSLDSLTFRSQFLGGSKNSLTLKHKNACMISTGRVGTFTVSASLATAEKPSTAPEIVLQPIKEISGAIKLPGSKSLSNRILLLAALSEVYNRRGLVGSCSFSLFAVEEYGLGYIYSFGELLEI